MKQFAELAAGVKQALESVGLGVIEVDVSDYSAADFGNFLAIARTDVGKVEIVYDRQFEILAAEGIDASTRGRIVLALEEQRRSSDW